MRIENWVPGSRASTPPRLHALTLVALVLLAVATPALADVITLRNGQELRGRVRPKGEQMRIELELGGTVVVDKGDIKNIVVEGPASATDEASAIPPELMKRLEERETAHVLIERLADEKAKVRLDAEKQLAEAGRGVAAIVRRALGEAPAESRPALLRVLAAMGDPEAVPEITKILHNPKEAALHAGAVAALAEIAGFRCVPTLTELLANSKDDAVRAACIEKLADLRPPFAAPFVAEAAKSAALRTAAYPAIAKWGDPDILPFVLPLLDGAARERAAGWVAELITPAHAAAFTKIFEAAKDAKTLQAGVNRLHKQFPVVGDIELLAAPAVQSLAFDHLRLVNKKIAGREPRDWQAERDAATKARLLVVPLGQGAAALARELAAEAQVALKVTVAADPAKSIPLAAAEGRPADARRALARLDLLDLEDFHSVRVIGVTTVDVTVPGCDYGLAPTRREGSVVLSVARLGGARDHDKMVSAARCLLLHALAKSLGLPACTDPACPAGRLYDARELEGKSLRYCADCQRAFLAVWDAESDAVAFRYRNAGQKMAALATQSKSKEAAAAAAYQYERALQPALAVTQWKEYQKLESDADLNGVVSKRIDLLDRVEKWLLLKGLAAPPAPPGPPPPPRKRGPAAGG